MTFHIQQLEQEFSVQLFEKIGRRMRLPAKEKKLLPHVIYELTRVMDTLREAAKRVGSGRGTTRYFRRNVALLSNAAGVAAFSATRSKVRLSLQSLNCYVIRDALLNDEADVGVLSRRE